MREFGERWTGGEEAEFIGWEGERADPRGRGTAAVRRDAWLLDCGLGSGDKKSHPTRLLPSRVTSGLSGGYLLSHASAQYHRRGRA